MKPSDKKTQAVPVQPDAKVPVPSNTDLDKGLAESFPASDPVSVSITRISPKDAKDK